MINAVCYTLLFIGGFGLVVQLVLGAHWGHFQHSGPVTHVHTGGGAHHATGHPSSMRMSERPAAPRGGANASRLEFALAILSPMTIFSVCLGAGATGLLIERFHLTLIEVEIGAAIGGIAFYTLVVKPLMSFILNFASKPSTALEGAISGEAEAISHFDSSGKGLVNVKVDGQLIRVLAILEDSDKHSASEISVGDHLLVTSIDGHTNACRVARI